MSGCRRPTFTRPDLITAKSTLVDDDEPRRLLFRLPCADGAWWWWWCRGAMPTNVGMLSLVVSSSLSDLICKESGLHGSTDDVGDAAALPNTTGELISERLPPPSAAAAGLLAPPKSAQLADNAPNLPIQALERRGFVVASSARVNLLPVILILITLSVVLFSSECSGVMPPTTPLPPPAALNTGVVRHRPDPEVAPLLTAVPKMNRLFAARLSYPPTPLSFEATAAVQCSRFRIEF